MPLMLAPPLMVIDAFLSPSFFDERYADDYFRHFLSIRH